MSVASSPSKGWFPALLLVALCAGAISGADAGAANVQTADTLRNRYTALQSRLSNNQFQLPLHLDSSETANGVRGDIHVLVNYPFATVAAALNSPGQWCDILMLHLNTKYCRASTTPAGDIINVSIGKKHDQPLDEAYRVVFAHRIAAQTPDYLQVTLSADEGPLSTSDYRIALEATPLDNGRTFIHLSYAYTYGLVGRLAMQAYLGTIGRDKVGFTVSGKDDDGRPRHIGGLRGVVERNTMRYYLAIEACLGALATPLHSRLEKRLQDWYAASERYPLQLHEMERGDYLDMKRREYRRQQATLPAERPG